MLNEHAVAADTKNALPLLTHPYNAQRARGVVRIGRTAVSKTDGWGFESLHPCHFLLFYFLYTLTLLFASINKIQFFSTNNA